MGCALGHDDIHRNVMRPDGHFVNHLGCISCGHQGSAWMAARQQTVVVAASVAQAPAVRVEAEAGYQDEIDLVDLHVWTPLRIGLEDPPGTR